MSDAQQFYVILAVFYLLECLKFEEAGSLALISGWIRPSSKPLPELLELSGLRKTVFVGPLLPWPRFYLASKHSSEAKHQCAPVKSVSSVRLRTRLLLQATQPLQHLSMLLFLLYFVLLPIVYSRFDSEASTLALIGSAYLLQIVAGITYFRVHRAFHPSQIGDRLKNLLYTLILPWHAMRCADSILTQTSRNWSALALLAANLEHPACRDLILKYWRETEWAPYARFRRETLRPYVRLTGIDLDRPLTPPASVKGPRYCPCCWVSYEESAELCRDCGGVPLAPR